MNYIFMYATKKVTQENITPKSLCSLYVWHEYVKVSFKENPTRKLLTFEDYYNYF